MAWVRIQPEIITHRKFLGLSSDAVTMWLYGLCWAVQNETDGVLTRPELLRVTVLCGLESNAEQVVSELIESGLWKSERNALRIHDYAEWQPTKAQVEEQNRHNAERQARWRERRNNAVSNGVSNGASPPLPSALKDLPPNPTPDGVGSLGSNSQGQVKIQDSPDPAPAPREAGANPRAAGTNPRARAAAAAAYAGAENWGRTRATFGIDFAQFEQMAQVEYAERPELLPVAVRSFMEAQSSDPTPAGSPADASAGSLKGVRESAAADRTTPGSEHAFGEGADSDAGRGAPNLTPGVRQ